MEFYTIFNNISAISWQSVLLVHETEIPIENLQPTESHWQLVQRWNDSPKFRWTVIFSSNSIFKSFHPYFGLALVRWLEWLFWPSKFVYHTKLTWLRQRWRNLSDRRTWPTFFVAGPTKICFFPDQMSDIDFWVYFFTHERKWLSLK